MPVDDFFLIAIVSIVLVGIIAIARQQHNAVTAALAAFDTFDFTGDVAKLVVQYSAEISFQ
ncbi:hypothetical protein [Halorubrum sp. Ea8]|uniref:hypothetical protein n=1 Tax=Halorubrum sp. Ea8 TaxID=1383841 RepID=UPI000B9947BD|nr:hypothetical protein [Halorubrum sp. Ea8]OYR49863.1 hypothetical protein DJ74_07520 [Halorubrum sp. Ea8]